MQAAEPTPALAIDRPYPGLRSFEPWEGFLFFGRDTHTDELLARLSVTRLLAVVGSSGSGKSSLVRAGLLPALYRGYLAGATSRWRVAVMRPGNSPLPTLAQALAPKEVLNCSVKDLRSRLDSSSFGLVNAVREARLQNGENLLLVIDQFEELFRFSRENRSPARAADAFLFVDLLLRAVEEFNEPIYIVLTMRSDFLGDCVRFPGLAEALNRSQYLVPRLTLDQRQTAIERPLDLAGARITPRLVQRLLADAGDPDQLPVLQHLLMRIYGLWKKEGAVGPLDLDHYDRTTESGSALDQHANEVYEMLSDEAKPWAEKLFRCITTKIEGKAVRRPAPLRWIYRVTKANSDESRGYINEVIRRLSSAENSLLFCTTSDRLGPRSIIDISHESLIRKWTLLQQWSEAESESAAWFRDVAGGILRKAAPLRDPDLARIEQLKAENGWNACWAAQYYSKTQIRFRQVEEFLARSRKAQDEDNRQKLTRQRREKRLLWAAIGLLTLLLGSLSLNWLFAQERGRERLQAEKAALESARRVSVLQNQAEEDRARLTRAEAAVPASGASADERKNLDELRKTAEASAEEARFAEERAIEEAKESHLQQTQIAAALKQISDLQTQLSQVRQQRDNAVAKQLATQDELAQRPTQSEYAAVKDQLRDALDGERTVRPQPAQGQPSPTAKVLPVSAVPITETALTTFKHDGSVTFAEFSPDSQRVVTSSADGSAAIWDASTGKTLFTLSAARGVRGTVFSASFSRDGKRVVTAGSDKTARVWSAENGRLLVTLGDKNPVDSAEFSPDGSRVLTACINEPARVWDVETGRVLSTLALHGFVTYAGFSPDGTRALTSSDEDNPRVWDARSGRPLATFIVGAPRVRYTFVEFSPDGNRVVTAADQVTVWDATTGGVVVKFAGLETAVLARFSPNGKQVVTSGADRTARLWDAQTGREVATLEGHTNRINQAVFSPNGNRVATASDDGTARVWDTGSGRPLATLIGHKAGVNTLRFSPDGKRLVTGSNDHTARVWDVGW